MVLYLYCSQNGYGHFDYSHFDYGHFGYGHFDHCIGLAHEYIIAPDGLSGYGNPASKVFSPEGGCYMFKDRNNSSHNKKERGQDLVRQLLRLVPFANLILKIIELLLNYFGRIC